MVVISKSLSCEESASYVPFLPTDYQQVNIYEVYSKDKAKHRVLELVPKENECVFSLAGKESS